MKTIDLTVLAVESNVNRAYLEYLRASNFQPKKIIDIKIKNRKIYYDMIKKLLGEKIAENLYDAYRIHYKKKQPIRREDQTVDKKKYKELGKIFIEFADAKPNFFSAIDYSQYCINVEKIKVSDINDKKLISFLEKQECKTFLFTGGGILKDQIFKIRDSRFIHVHPGIVPEVKGSDGLLWSILIKGNTGMSCFYMNRGIDTGEIIYTREYINLLSKLDIDIDYYGYYNIYRALLDFYDPILRARTLVSMLKEVGDNKLNNLPTTCQSPNDGRMYYLMHPKIREKAIEAFLLKDNRETMQDN
ncbi:hypothetical protein [Sedimentibacter sp.]|uniref:hypothetical protein n=1 Tax=Sedimentibacter sp. TaxID=1960295 RepID=UPI0028ABDADC|nr:hypothetical protein [Sedimentibacter sp.]